MLKPVKLDKETRRKLSERLDPKLIKTRKQFKGPDLSYISANTCIDLLNNAFGHNWSMRIVDRWMEEGVPAPFIEKDGRKPVPQPPTAWCIVELEVNLKDEDGQVFTITKSAFGSQAINGNQATQAVNGYKGAQSDALKKAATLLGIALELYRKDEGEQSFFEELNDDLFIIWTDELREQYSSQFAYIDQICELNGYSYDDLSYWVVMATGEKVSDLKHMPPEYIDTLIDILSEDADIEHPETKGGKA